MKKVAVIGYGGQGKWHCDMIKDREVAEVVGIYDIHPVRCDVARQNGLFVYESREALLADPTVEIVVVATPNDSHREIVIAALDAGKHVICEKPVEMTVEAFDNMVAACHRSGKLFTVHQNRRWDTNYLAVKKFVEDGELGEALHIETRVHGSRGIPGDWRQNKHQGGGMVLDWGVHLLDQILQIFKGPIVSVYCELTNYTNNEVDDGFTIHLTFESGVTALVEVGTHNFLVLPRFYLLCTEGTVIVPDWSSNAHVARMKLWNEKEVTPVQTAAGITKTMAPRDDVTIEEFDVPLPKSDVHDFYRNFCAAIDGKEAQLITHAEVRRVLQVMQAAFVSAENRCVVNEII